MEQPLQQPIYVAPNYNPQTGATGQPFQNQDPKVIVVQQSGPAVDNRTLWIVLAILLGGIGTMIAASSLPPEKSSTYMCYGVLQIILSWIFVGWIWAIINAVQGYP